MSRYRALSAVASFFLVMTLGSAHAVLLFEDDFNDGILDVAKWLQPTGNYVVESGGVLDIHVASIDNGGKISSVPIILDNATGLITMSSRKLVHKDSGSLSYLRAYHDLVNGDGAATARIEYYDYHYRVDLVGFGDVDNAEHYDPVYDTWFDEVLTYDPITGVSTYSINGGPVMPLWGAPLVGDTIQLHHFDYDWFTGHYIYVEDIRIEQEPGQSVPDGGATLISLGLGILPLLWRRK